MEPPADDNLFKCPLGALSETTDVAVTLNYCCELPAEGEDGIRFWLPDLLLPGAAILISEKQKR